MSLPLRLQAKSDDFIYWLDNTTPHGTFKWRPPYFDMSPPGSRLSNRRITPPEQHHAAQAAYPSTAPRNSELDKLGVPQSITCTYLGRLKVGSAQPQKETESSDKDLANGIQDSGYMVAVSTADSTFYVIAGDLPQGDAILALPPARRLGPALQLCSDRRFSHAKIVQSHSSDFWTISDVGALGFLVNDEALTDEYTFHDYLNKASSILESYGGPMERAQHIAKKLALPRAEEAALFNRLSYGCSWRGFAECIFTDLESLTLSSSLEDLEICRDHVYAQAQSVQLTFSDYRDEYELRFFHHQLDYPPSHKCTWPCNYCTAEPNDLPSATLMAFQDPTGDEVSFIMPFASLWKRDVGIDSGIVVARNISKKEYWAIDRQSLDTRAQDLAETEVETDEDSGMEYTREPAAGGLLRSFAARMVNHDAQAYRLGSAQEPIILQPLLGDSAYIQPAIRRNGTISVFEPPSRGVGQE